MGCYFFSVPEDGKDEAVGVVGLELDVGNGESGLTESRGLGFCSRIWGGWWMRLST